MHYTQSKLINCCLNNIWVMLLSINPAVLSILCLFVTMFMFFLHNKTIRLISRNQYDVIWYYLFKNLKDDWKSYLTVGAWLAVAFVVTVSQREKSAEVFYKTELIAQRTFPSWSGQPPYSAKHNEICTRVVSYDAVWFCYLVLMFSAVVLQIRRLHLLWGEAVFMPGCLSSQSPSLKEEVARMGLLLLSWTRYGLEMMGRFAADISGIIKWQDAFFQCYW